MAPIAEYTDNKDAAVLWLLELEPLCGGHRHRTYLSIVWCYVIVFFSTSNLRIAIYAAAYQKLTTSIRESSR